MNKSILQFHDGQMIRQRVVYTHLILSFVRDLERCGIDMATVITTTRFAADLPLGYLNYEYPLVGHRTRGIWEGGTITV